MLPIRTQRVTFVEISPENNLSLDEISKRLISGQDIVINAQIAKYVIQKIIDHCYPKAVAYRNVRRACMSVYPYFDQDFMKALCRGYVESDKITPFFEEARAFKIEHKHLFDLIDRSQLLFWAKRAIETQIIESLWESKTS